MEYKEGEVNPPSISDLLRQQVNEQSEHCDVTVKVGEWTKKFHWCILVASPFFDAVYRNQYFEEKSTGMIELHFQHPYSIVEDAILFLYGRQPEITIKKIDGIFEMAEFLLLPTLKAQCVQWLNNVEVSNDTCFKIVHIVCLFDLHLSSFEDFFRGNLLKLLDKNEAVDLDVEMVTNMLNDTDLSYVSVKQWFRFLVRWTKADLRREVYFGELFSLLDVSDVNEELRKEMFDEILVTRLGNFVLKTIKASLSETSQVVIFPAGYWARQSGQRNVSFLFGNGRWCGINGDLDYISGTIDKSSPVVYKNKYKIGENTIHLLDLSCQENDETTTRLDIKDTAKGLTWDVKIAIHQSKCYAVAKGYNVINLYRGDLQEGQTSMEPLVCILEDEHIDDLAVDMSNNIVMFLGRTDEVIIYNDAECFVERVNLGNWFWDFDDKYTRLIARECGFVLINKNQICCISVAQGHSMQTRFEITLSSISEEIKYIICEDFCFRIENERDTDFTFSYTNVDDLKTAITEEVNWVKMEHLPRDLEIGDNAFMVTLPKDMLRCSLNCPHCPTRKKRTPRSARYLYERKSLSLWSVMAKIQDGRQNDH